MEALLTDLVSRVTTYHPEADVALLRRAFEFGKQHHTGQRRKSGEAYFTHPVSVARVITELKLDTASLCAALLHDTVEDTKATLEDVQREFGDEVAFLVDGVTKLSKFNFTSKEDRQAESFRKMLLAMARDIRVLLIKLADRLHNMRTMDAMAADKQRRIAQETLEIYAPIAHRLGLNQTYRELQELSFRHIHPWRYAALERARQGVRGSRRDLIDRIRVDVEQAFARADLKVDVQWREKTLYAIYLKMRNKHLSFAKVNDLFGFRILVSEPMQCYMGLGVLHGLYKPQEGRFKDYIAIPKANGYQSLHTTLIGPFGTPVEIQIRTADMHMIAEAGVAAHWMYKSLGDGSLTDIQQKTHQWLQSLLDLQSGTGDPLEFLEHIKVDLFPDSVYVFSPKGKIHSLRKDSTAIDFAYAIHSDIGNRAVAARINEEDVPLSTRLKNGDRVEIITDETGRPSAAWLNYAVSGRARSHIRHYLKTRQQAEAIELGELLLIQAVRALNFDPNDIGRIHWNRMLKGDAVKSKEAVLSEIGLGKRLAAVVARKLFALSELEAPAHQSREALLIRGTEDLAVQFAPCCRPIPGDPILAQMKGGQGLVIHTHDCPNVRSFRNERDKWLDVQWDPRIDRLFNVDIRVTVTDRRGVLAKIAAEITAADSNIAHVNMGDPNSGGDKYAVLTFTLDVRHRMHLAQVMRQLRKLPEVVRIARVKAAGAGNQAKGKG